MADFIGLDTCLSIMRIVYEGLGDTKYRPCPLLVKYVEAGWLGRKTGRGFYDYSGDTPSRPVRGAISSRCRKIRRKRAGSFARGSSVARSCRCVWLYPPPSGNVSFSRSLIRAKRIMQSTRQMMQSHDGASVRFGTL